MSNPEVSVVITTYNEENFIEKAIKSVLNQTLPKNMYELIVIDDGGVDSTEHIISNLQSKTDFEINHDKIVISFNDIKRRYQPEFPPRNTSHRTIKILREKL